MVILAVDSGVEKTGYAIFNNDSYIKSGLIKTSKKKSLEKRLEEIYLHLKKIIQEYKPRKIILEQVFFFKNQKTVISVSQSQGIILLLAAQFLIEVEYLTPLQIKQTITGYGRADKKAVQKMIKMSFNIPIPPQDDEIDAIACGLTYCHLNKKLVK